MTEICVESTPVARRFNFAWAFSACLAIICVAQSLAIVALLRATSSEEASEQVFSSAPAKLVDESLIIDKLNTIELQARMAATSAAAARDVAGTAVSVAAEARKAAKNAEISCQL